MYLFQFQGGVASYPVSNDQAVSEILGLGTELYVNKKKVDMLQDPSAYLLQRNKALLAAGSNNTGLYANSLDQVVKAVKGKTNKKDLEYIAASNQLWVKLLACDMTAKIASVELGFIDIKYPILDSAYKAQKSKNSRELEAKKEFIKEGTK
jgi:hypothetical protein